MPDIKENRKIYSRRVAVPTRSHLCQKTGRASRCRSSAQTENPDRSPQSHRNAFLNNRFLPFFNDRFSIMNRKEQIETDFFRSMRYLCQLHGIPLLQRSSKPFPLNIAEAIRTLKENMSSRMRLDLVLLQKRTRCSLATVKTFDTDRTLYYIPVKPLWALIAKGVDKQSSDLLLSIFSYLYQIVRVPWHDEPNFLSYAYCGLFDWYLESEEPESVSCAIEEIQEMWQRSSEILKAIKQKNNLEKFEQRIKDYSGSPELKALADKYLVLYKQHPTRNIYDSLPERLLYPEVEDRISADWYLSFYWDAKGEVCQELMDYVNNCLQEQAVMDEPLSVQVFDRPQQEHNHAMQFESELFSLLNELCDILNELT